MCLRHYNIKSIVQKAARTQEDYVTDLHDDRNEKKVHLRDGMTCVTARAPPNKRLLSHLTLKEPHPLWKKLNLMVCPLSGTPSDSLTFLEKSQTSSWLQGDQVLKNNTKVTSKSGSRFVIRGQLITVHHRSVMF